jgi:hypothetical protein
MEHAGTTVVRLEVNLYVGALGVAMTPARGAHSNLQVDIVERGSSLCSSGDARRKVVLRSRRSGGSPYALD